MCQTCDSWRKQRVDEEWPHHEVMMSGTHLLRTLDCSLTIPTPDAAIGK